MIAALKRYGPMALIAALFVAFIASGAWRRLSLSELQSHHAALATYVQVHPFLSLGAFFGLYALVVIACVPGPSVMSLAGGYLFGALVGGATALAACVVGSVVVFLACRTAFGDWAARRAGPRLQAVQARFATNALAAVTMLRLIPMLPISATTLAAGLGGAPLSALTFGTLIGSAPISFVFAGLGAGLHDVLDRGGRIDAHLFAQPKILLSLTGLAVLAALPLVWRLTRRRRVV